PYPHVFGLCFGRQAGKTTIGEKLAWNAIFAPPDDLGPPVVRVTADTEEHAMKIWRSFEFHATATDLGGFVTHHTRDPHRFEFINGANIQLMSSANPQALAGDSVTCWIIDEAQYLSWEAWENLLPSIVTRHGVVVMTG